MKLYHCDDCDKKFSTKALLENHVKRINLERIKQEVEDSIEYQSSELYVEEFPGCCGAAILSDLPFDDFYDGSSYIKDGLKKAPKLLLEGTTKAIKNVLKELKSYGVIFATTNKQQKITGDRKSVV